MFVTVADILKIKALGRSRILAGKKGLSNIVSSINIYEYILRETYDRTGVMYLTSFYYIKDQGEEALFEHIKILIDTNCPGLILGSGAFSELSKKTVALADKNNFPIVTIGDKVSYASILNKTFELIHESSKLSDKCIAFHRMMNLEDLDAVEKHMARLNPLSTTYFYVAYISLNEKIAAHELSLSDSMEFFEYDQNHVLILNSDTIVSDVKLKTQLSEIFKPFDFHIGVSDVSSSPKLIKDCVEQSKYVHHLAKNIMKGNMRTYNEIGIYKMLLSICENPKVIEQSKAIVDLVKAYDLDYNSKILKTFSMYLKNDHDVVATAHQMFLHKNTVRYRLKKIESIIENSNNDCIEQLSMAVRVLWLINEL